MLRHFSLFRLRLVYEDPIRQQHNPVMSTWECQDRSLEISKMIDLVQGLWESKMNYVFFISLISTPGKGLDMHCQLGLA